MSSAERFVGLTKYVLSVPGLLLALFRSIWKTAYKLGSKFVVLPLNTLSGKLFTITLVLVAADVVGVLLYVLGTWQNVDSWVSLGTTVLTYGVAALVVPATLFVITYPLDRLGWIGDAIVTSGIRQRSRMSSGLLAVVSGVVVGVLLGLATAYLHAFQTGRDLTLGGLDRRVLVVAFVVTAIASTFLLFYTAQKRNRSVVRTDLSIETVTESDDGERTVVLRNGGNEPVDLWEAKIEDSDGNHYTLDVQPRLRPGETSTFVLPAKFSLDTIDDVPRGIAPFFGGKKVTSIYARRGDTYVLEWHDVAD